MNQLWRFLMSPKDMDFRGLPSTNDYATYGNVVSGRKFVTAISQHIESKQVEEVRSSPCFSLLLDESTDRTLESHHIVYLSYIYKGGLDQPKSLFLSLSAICNGTAQSIYDTWISTYALYRLQSSKFVGLATDGAAAILGKHNGFAAKFKRDVPGLFSVHCIAHREALAASDAFKKIKQLGFLERLANKVYGWLGMSSLQNGELQGLLKIMDMEKVKLLHVHSVRWLSMGQVMTRFADILPTLLTLFRDCDQQLYNDLRIFKVVFCIYLLADVLQELNVLSKNIQTENVDLSKFGAQIELTTRSLTRMFLDAKNFGGDSKYIKTFMEVAKDGIIEYRDKTGTIHSHTLFFQEISSYRDLGYIFYACKRLA